MASVCIYICIYIYIYLEICVPSNPLFQVPKSEALIYARSNRELPCKMWPATVPHGFSTPPKVCRSGTWKDFETLWNHCFGYSKSHVPAGFQSNHVPSFKGYIRLPVLPPMWFETTNIDQAAPTFDHFPFGFQLQLFLDEPEVFRMDYGPPWWFTLW